MKQYRFRNFAAAEQFGSVSLQLHHTLLGSRYEDKRAALTKQCEGHRPSRPLMVARCTVATMVEAAAIALSTGPSAVEAK